MENRNLNNYDARNPLRDSYQTRLDVISRYSDRISSGAICVDIE